MTAGLAPARPSLRLLRRRPPRTVVIGAALIGCWILLALLGPLFAGDPTALHLDLALLPPEPAHPFGTDNLGREVLARIVHGAAIDLQIGLFTVLPALTIGSIVGALAGYYGGIVDTLVMRLVDVVVAFPFFVLVIAIVAVLGPGLINMYIAVALVGWVSYARIVRSEMMVAKQLDYTSAARVLGFSDARILLRHLVPNVIVQALIYATSDFILGILLGSSLGFLGLGAQPPAPEWGVMIAEGYSFVSGGPWISAFPGLIIVLLAGSFSLFGDGLADHLRPEIER